MKAVNSASHISFVGTDKIATLPAPFLERMQGLLGEEYPDFLSSYENKRLYGLRFNPLKTDREGFIQKMPFTLQPVAWTKEGFYYDSQEQPGKHFFHEAGAYYIQEPSAMAVAEVLEPEPGECILDLCAAPGGKSTQIAGKMAGKGILVANEIIPDRAKVLSQNIERMGIANAVVCNETPERLAKHFGCFFDRILVDAPCSGEGMFRKEENAIREWSSEHVEMCTDRQKSILEQAALMLKPGGILVYSTCTFSVQENEGVISDFLNRHEDFFIEKTSFESYFEPGRKEWTEEKAEGIEHTLRLWPHKLEGEGHYIARLKKSVDKEVMGIGTGKVSDRKMRRADREIRPCGKRLDKESARICLTFLKKELGLSVETLEDFEKTGEIISFGEQIYLVPKKMTSLSGLKTLRPGLHLGMMKKNRFEPSHALALYLSPEKMCAYYEMTREQAAIYLRGETFACDASIKGWRLLTIDGYALGFGKAGGGLMKNHYPKGLRKEVLYN